ncbi:MAG: HAMP domain-containing histidine kinase [Planctomycetes bacterium]|nr:HAMP domain-containing histidine kinase [Planctomycetota bacterium]
MSLRTKILIVVALVHVVVLVLLSGFVSDYANGFREDLDAEREYDLQNLTRAFRESILSREQVAPSTPAPPAATVRQRTGLRTEALANWEARHLVLTGVIREAEPLPLPRLVGRTLRSYRIPLAPLLELRWVAFPRFPLEVFTDMLLRAVAIETRASKVARQQYNINAWRRPVEFDMDRALLFIDEAIRSGRTIQGTHEGYEVYAFPLTTSVDEPPWGGAYVLYEPSTDVRDLGRVLTLALVLSTLLLVIIIYVVLSVLVVRPMERLGAGASRVAHGDYTLPVDDPGGVDEMAQLVRSFNLMMSRVQHFSEELGIEVERAMHKAMIAERQLLQARRLATTGRLAAGIAHEINNPLGGLMNATEALRHREDMPPARRREYLELVGEGLARIQEIVRRVLQFTPRHADAERFPLVSALRQAITLVSHRIQKEGVTLALELDEDAEVHGLVHEIQQVFLNLLINALDALQELTNQRTPRIEVVIDTTDRGVVALVRDNGPGMPEELLSDARELFFTTKEVGRGTGLGLSLCAGILENHGGTMHLRSSVGLGFEVELRFPKADAVALEKDS